MNKEEIISPLAEKIYKWLREQKYGEENLLHAAVCCDFAGMVHFKKALTQQLQSSQSEDYEDYGSAIANKRKEEEAAKFEGASKHFQSS